ncbi:MAG: hypothetical protein HC869_23735 [Rhodospirillales bacterium]|nr:hypothetical protein [Rhodospirillales bacterium]
MRAWARRAMFAPALIAASVPCALAAPSDDEVKQLIIQESIASYPGNCPCPYNRAANGSKCGKRSAWSKPGGYSPICYPEEVTPQMIDQWRRASGG